MPRHLSHYNEAIREGALLDSKAPAGGTAAGSLVIVPLYETVQINGLGASSASQTAFVCDQLSGTYQLAGVAVNFGTASSSGTLQVEVASSGTSQGSGTNQLTGTVSLSGTANTAVNGTVIASPTQITSGSRINIILAGTLTGLANGSVSLVLQRTA